MVLKEQNVLILERTMGIGGSSQVVLQICKALQPHVNKIVVCSSGGAHTEKLKKMNMKHVTIPDICDKRAFLTISKILKKIVCEEKITIIHSHHRMAAFYVEVLGLYSNRFFLHTAHGEFFDKRFLTRYALRHAKIVACGECVKSNLKTVYKLPNDQVDVVKNAVEPTERDCLYDEQIQKHRKEGKFIVANIGRLSWEKGFDYYVSAIPYVISKHPNSMFLVVGTGKDENKLIELVQKLKISEYVHFLGYRSDAREIMTQVDLIVLSSLTEGLPLTPIEAFCAGKTIVATDVGGTSEVVQHNINGILVKAKDEVALAEAINWLIDDQDKRKKLEKAARQTFLDDYNMDKFFREYILCYEKLIKRG